MRKYVGIKPYTYWRYPFRTLYKWVTEFPGVIKSFAQRGYRGYAREDTWDIATYLSEWMPVAIRELRDRQTGWPISMIDFIEGEEEQFILWQNILTDIADGFEAHRMLEERPYLKDAPSCNFLSIKSADGYNVWDTENDPFVQWLDEHREEHLAWEAERYERANHGLALFAEFYMGLWD